MKVPFSPSVFLALAAASGLVSAAGCRPAAPPRTPTGTTREPDTDAPLPTERVDPADTNPLTEAEADPAEGKACCKGRNDCHNQGSCAVEGRHECKGQNECKGKGGCNAHCPK